MMERLRGFVVVFSVVACAATSLGGIYTSKSYVQSGLIAQWDGIDNVGTGAHDSGAAVWKDLKGNYDLTLIGSGAWSASGDSLVVSGPSAVGAVAGPKYKTIEIVYKMTDPAGRLLYVNGDGRARIVVFDSNGTVGYFRGDSSTKRVTYT